MSAGITTIVPVVLCTALLSACVDESETDPIGDDTNADNHGEALELADTYGIQLDSVVVTRNTETGQESSLEVTAGLVGRVEQNQRALQIEMQPCFAVPPELDGNQLTIDDKVVQSLPPIRLGARLVAKTDSSDLLTVDPAIMVLGARLDDPSQSLPESEDDPRVLDQDGDGEPGITMGVSLFSVFASAKLTMVLEASVTDPRSITGNAEFSMETQIYGDTIPFVDAAETVAEANANTEVVKATHRFELQAIPASSGCSNL